MIDDVDVHMQDYQHTSSAMRIALEAQYAAERAGKEALEELA